MAEDRVWRILLLLVLVVVGIVFWNLHFTGVAMTNKVYCGQKEHNHSDDCYDLVLACGLKGTGAAKDAPMTIPVMRL